MRKTVIAAVLALVGSTAVCAQKRMSEEERAKTMAERIEKSADRLAKDFNLKDDAKKTFVDIYSEYQKEMFATNQPQGQRQQANLNEEKKELSKEEATAKIKENFDRQEQQIATMQKRLDTQKKFAEKFSEVLTPQQILKVLTPQRGQGQRGQDQRMNNDGNQRRNNFEEGTRRGFGDGPRGGGFRGPDGF